MPTLIKLEKCSLNSYVVALVTDCRCSIATIYKQICYRQSVHNKKFLESTQHNDGCSACREIYAVIPIKNRPIFVKVLTSYHFLSA